MDKLETRGDRLLNERQTRRASWNEATVWRTWYCGSAASRACEADSELQIQDYSLGKCSENVFFLIGNILLDGRPHCELFLFPSSQ